MNNPSTPETWVRDMHKRFVILPDQVDAMGLDEETTNQLYDLFGNLEIEILQGIPWLLQQERVRFAEALKEKLLSQSAREIQSRTPGSETEYSEGYIIGLDDAMKLLGLLLEEKEGK